MSDVVAYKGKIKPLHKPWESSEEVAKILLSTGGDKPEWCETYVEWLLDMDYEKFALIDNVLHSVESEPIPPEDIFTSHRNIDGSISFIISYYNGGIGFSEALQFAVDDLEDI